jgi:cell division protein FtsL
VNPSYTVHRPVANEYLVRERDRRRLRELVHVVLVLAPVALALTAFTWTHLQVLDAGYRIAELEGHRHELDRRESRLRLEAAYLASPSLIERRARAELGMRPPALDQLVFFDSEQEGRAGASLAPPGGRGIEGEGGNQ